MMLEGLKKQDVVICALEYTYLMTEPYIPQDKLNSICWVSYYRNAQVSYFPDIVKKINNYHKQGVKVIFLTGTVKSLEIEELIRRNIENSFPYDYQLIMKDYSTESDTVFKQRVVSDLITHSNIVEFLDDSESTVNAIKRLNINVTHVKHSIPEKESDVTITGKQL